MRTEEQMKEEINRQRELHNRPIVRDLKTGRMEQIDRYSPGDRGYLPPVTEFITIQFQNGMVVMPAEDFKRLPKSKQKKLMRW